MTNLFLFYEEPDPDRFLRFDRYPRAVVRRFLRGSPQPGGVMRWFLNLRSGLDSLGVAYHVNDYVGLARNQGSVAHVIGKPHVVFKFPASRAIIYGPGVSAHPLDHLPGTEPWSVRNILGILTSCEWFRCMYRPHVPAHIPIEVWAAGIDTTSWRPLVSAERDGKRILVYDKIRWDREYHMNTLLAPILEFLHLCGCKISYLRYGAYREEEFRRQLGQSDAMVFLCEHETQGFAYLQGLAMNVPIMAWDRGGLWRDPSLFPHRVQYQPVSSVPYFDEQCGVRFTDATAFRELFPAFLERTLAAGFTPRDYVTSELSLGGQAKKYLELCRSMY